MDLLIAISFIPSLTTGSEVVTLSNGFAVGAGTPVITQVNPNTGQQGQTNLNVAITGIMLAIKPTGLYGRN